MARYVGKDADFHVGAGMGTEVFGCNKWSLDDNAPELDLSGFDSGTRGTFSNGRPSTTIAFSGHWDTNEVRLYSPGANAIPVIAAGQQGVLMTCYLLDGGPYFQCTVNISTMHYEADEGGAVDWNGTARVTGNITWPV